MDNGKIVEIGKHNDLIKSNNVYSKFIKNAKRMKDQILKELNEAKNVIDKFINDDAIINAIEESAKIMTVSINNGGKIISCGNGGSMCDAIALRRKS